MVFIFSIKYTQLIGKKISYTVTNNKNSYLYAITLFTRNFTKLQNMLIAKIKSILMQVNLIRKNYRNKYYIYSKNNYFT